MTTIVTTTGNNFAALIADRGITSDVIHPDMPKIIQQKTWLIAVAGSDRACDVIQYCVKYPAPPQALLGKRIDDWYGWVVVNVIPRIAQAVKESGLTEFDGEAILVTHGKAFYLTSTLGLLKADPYWAIGSGSQLALGSLAADQYNDDWNKNHDLIAKRSLSIASMHDPFTRGTVDTYISDHTGRIR